MRAGTFCVVSVVVLCLAGLAPAAEAQVSIDGSLAKFAFKNVNNTISTSSTTLVPMQQTTVTFTKGAPTGAVLIVFCGEFQRPGAADRVLLQARVDSTIASPSLVTVGSADTTALPAARTHCFTFALDNVAAGSHTARFRWATEGNSMNLTRRTVTVYHN